MVVVLLLVVAAAVVAAAVVVDKDVEETVVLAVGVAIFGGADDVISVDEFALV